MFWVGGGNDGGVAWGVDFLRGRYEMERTGKKG
jgi:hypothetical protein